MIRRRLRAAEEEKKDEGLQNGAWMPPPFPCERIYSINGHRFGSRSLRHPKDEHRAI